MSSSWQTSGIERSSRPLRSRGRTCDSPFRFSSNSMRLLSSSSRAWRRVCILCPNRCRRGSVLIFDLLLPLLSPPYCVPPYCVPPYYVPPYYAIRLLSLPLCYSIHCIIHVT